MAAPIPGPNKRKRIAPILVSDAAGNAKQPAATPFAEAPQCEQSEPQDGAQQPVPKAKTKKLQGVVLLKDPKAKQEVKVMNQKGRGAKLTCWEQGVEAWTRSLPSSVSRVALGGGFVAFAVGRELSVVSASKDLSLLPPVLLHSAPTCLRLSSEGHLAALLFDGSLVLLNVHGPSCIARTMLPHILQPDDVLRLRFKSGTSEPLVQVNTTHKYLFQLDAKAWTCLTCLSSRPMANPSGTAADGTRLEGGFLAAAKMRDSTELRAHLGAMARHCQARYESKMRYWCEILLQGNGRKIARESPWAWIAQEIHFMRLDGRSLLREDVLPVLPSGALRSELEELLKQPQNSPPLF